MVIEDSQAGITAGLAAGRSRARACPAVQAVAPEPGLTLLEDLTGVDVALLADLVTDRSPVDVPVG